MQERHISLLETVAAAGRPVSAAEILTATGLPKPTCYRLIQKLAEQNLLDEPNDDGQFIIGERLLRIAQMGKSDADVRQCAAPLLKVASSNFAETVFLARFRDNAVEIIHVETPKDPARAFIHPGLGERPLHACSCAKAIAAFAQREVQERILSGSLKKFTAHTKISKAKLRKEFTDIAKRGFAHCDEEIDLGIASVAAPVSISNIGAIFSVGAVGPIRRFDKECREVVGQQLTHISTKIGGAIQLCKVTELY